MGPGFRRDDRFIANSKHSLSCMPTVLPCWIYVEHGGAVMRQEFLDLRINVIT